LEELLAGIGEGCPELNHRRALTRAFVAANVSRNGLVPRREFRLTLEYALFFRNASDALDRLERLASPHDDDRLSFHEFVQSVHALLPDSDYDEAQLHLHFDLLDKDEQGYVRFADVCSWAATEHVATKGGDAGAHGSPRVAYVWDGEPLSVAASAKNWREAVRNHWMASARLQDPERLPHALRVGRAQAAAEAESVRSRSAQASATADIDGSHRAGEDQRPATTNTAAVSAAVETEQGTDPPELYGDTFEMPNKDRRRETFARMDRNRNGKLSVEDYLAELDALWPGLHGEHPASVQRAFAAADTRHVGLLGTREFPRLLEYTLYFYRYRAEFDTIDQEGQGRVDESKFDSICKRTGVLLSDADKKREFAALDRHDPVNGLYQSGYIQFDQYCCWAAKHYVRAGRKSSEEARMLERSKQRQDRTKSRDPPGANFSGRSEHVSRTPEHHRSGHGSHSRAWERHKGMEGADTFYNLDRNPGQEWEERRHGAAFRR
jgi:Ca2+-binding EF-hand superfamily protein